MVKYIEKIQYAGEDVQYVGGDFSRGKWNFKNPLPLITNQTFTPGYYDSYDLSEYIPNDGHDYEVMFSMRSHTGNTDNNTCHWWVRSGSKDNYWLQARIVGVRTNVGSYDMASATVIIPIHATDRAIGFYLETGSHATGSTYLTIHGYRKINNTNKEEELLLQQPFYFLFNNDNETYTFGGTITVGKWVVLPKTIISGVSIPKDTVYSIDLSEYLPEDDTYTYECIIDGTVTTTSTTGEYTCFYIDIEDDDGNIASTEVASLYVRSGATKYNYFNTRIPVRANNRTIKVRNGGKNSSITLSLRSEGYRRMGYYG